MTVAEEFDADAAVAELVAGLNVPKAAPSRVEFLLERLLDRDGLANLPKPEWQVKSWFQTGSLVVTYGKPGHGKTFFGLDVACSITTGSTWHYNATQAGPCLYIAAEGASMFDARVSAWETYNNTRVSGLYVLPYAVNLLDAEWAEAIAEVASRIGAVHVTIDTLNRCFVGGDENSARDMGSFVASCDIIRHAGPTVHVLHHDSRAGGGPRGHSSLDGAADTIIAVSADNGIVTLRQTKQKDAEEAPQLLLRLTGEGNSAVLADYIDSGNLDGPRLEAFSTLCEIADENGVASGVWERATGLAERTFHRSRKWLLEHDFCHDISGSKTPRYAPTEAGRQSSANQLPSTATTVGEVLPATPPLFRGGSWQDSHDPTEETAPVARLVDMFDAAPIDDGGPDGRVA